MFLDALDTVKASETYRDEVECGQSKVQAEAMLYHLLLMGKKPRLTLPQITDSKVIHTIANDKHKQFFYQLIEGGNFEVALFGKHKSIRNYFCNVLQQGIDGGEFFRFSALPCLELYKGKTRAALHRKMIEGIQEGHYHFDTADVRPEHIEEIQEVVQLIEHMNVYAKQNYKTGKIPAKSMEVVFKEMSEQLSSQMHTTEETQAAIKELLSKVENYNARTSYYEALDKLKENKYSQACLKLIREMVDSAYNIVVAESVDDQEGASINVGASYAKQVTQAMSVTTKHKQTSHMLIKPSQKKQCLTWESMSEIFEEVCHIQKEKNCTREEALRHYKKHQTLTPAIQISKYISYGIGGGFIPGIGGSIEIIGGLIDGAIAETIEGKLKKPGLADVIMDTQKARLKQRVVDETLAHMNHIAYTSIHIE